MHLIDMNQIDFWFISIRDHMQFLMVQLYILDLKKIFYLY
jgi:hypothetical protein